LPGANFTAQKTDPHDSNGLAALTALAGPAQKQAAHDKNGPCRHPTSENVTACARWSD